MISAPVFSFRSGWLRSLLCSVALVALLAPNSFAADGYLGVQIQDLNETLAAALDLDATDGVLIGDVVDGSPAEEAGLKRGDVILSINDKDATDVESFTSSVRSIDSGETARVKILRKGKHKTIKVELGEAAERDQFFSKDDEDLQMDPRGNHRMWFGNDKDGAFDVQIFGDDEDGPIKVFSKEFVFEDESGAHLGVNIHDLDKDLGAYFGTTDGVLVLGVTEDSPAAEAGLKAGDVITGIDDDAVADTPELLKELAKFEPGDTVAVKYLRHGKKQSSVDVELAESPGMEMVRELRTSPESGPHFFPPHGGPDAPMRMHMRTLRGDQGDLKAELQTLREQLERLEEQMQQEGQGEE